MGCIKILLMVINVVFFLAGAAVMAVGLFVHFDQSFTRVFLEEFGTSSLTNYIDSAAYILIAFGAFTFVAGFLGCCGAMKKSKCMIGIYIAMIVVVLAAEIGGGVYVYVNKDTVIEALQDEATKLVKANYDNSSAASQALNDLMTEAKCCGVTNYTDFFGSPFTNNNLSREVIPNACCERDANDNILNEVACLAGARNGTQSSSYINKGCYEALEDFVAKNAVILLGVGLGFALFEILVTIMAIVYCCNIDKDD